MYPTVSLVLSSGGARCAAHIGVIEELERQGFKIKAVAGSSIGALIGGIYASGNLQIFKDWISKLDKTTNSNFSTYTYEPIEVLDWREIMNKIKKIMCSSNIEDLPVSFRAVAIDTVNYREVVLDKGNLFEAICASITFPTSPSRLDGNFLIDGGFLNPLPINLINRAKDDLLIAIDVNSPTQSNGNDLNCPPLEQVEWLKFSSDIDERHHNYPNTLMHSINLMIQQISSMAIKLYQPDLLIKIPMVSYENHCFYKSKEIIKAGELAMHKALFEF